jgi:predicted ATPase
MADTIKKLTIEGFKSIRKLEDFPLRALNVLIGANGAGKSNFVGFFRLLREMVEQRLQLALATTEGGADACLYLGPKITGKFAAKLHFGQNGYEFALVPTPDNRLFFLEETIVLERDSNREWVYLGSGHPESKLRKGLAETEARDARRRAPYDVYESVSSWVVYHFHDTSLSAPVQRPRTLNDNEIFRPHADNLAPFLYRIQRTHPESYSRILDVVRLAAPFFDDFKLRPMPGTADIQLEWRQRDSDYPFRALQLSDGTLRFICLATALLQPTPPPTVLFDEPELGLHPYALTLLGNLLKQAPMQVIVSTQAAPLLNEFEPEDVIVVERTNGESTFRRLDSANLSEWLEEYTLGELWQKNVLGGRPLGDRRPEPVFGGGERHS